MSAKGPGWVRRHGVRVTSPVRTVLDLQSRLEDHHLIRRKPLPGEQGGDDVTDLSGRQGPGGVAHG